VRRCAAALAALAALVLLSSCGEDPTTPAPTPSPTANGVFSSSDAPEGTGGTLVAALEGEIVTCEGWGLADHESGVQAGCDTVYDIGSMTKQFTAAAILKLERQGELRVIDPIDRYLPDVPADKREITVQQLLTHTAGLIASLGSDYDPLSRADLIARAFSSELRSPPGSRHHYSNVGYSLLTAIVEEASGMGYEEYLSEHLLGPAGMTQTGYVLPDWQPEQVAVEYDAEGVAQGRPFDHPWADDGPWWNLRGNGGLLSTAGDMFRWHRALEGDDVLDEQAKHDLFEPRVLEEPGGGSYYAYGWVVFDSDHSRVLWHNGGNGWSYGEVARLPESGAMVFWVTNQYRGTGEWNLERNGSALTQGVLERLLE
jgi:CubicO group peptidase (beta-lactamase class C family)